MTLIYVSRSASYVRAQSVYFDDFRILGALPPRWVVDCFFVESLGVSYDTIIDVLARRWVGGAGMPLKDLEGKLIRVRHSSCLILWGFADELIGFIDHTMVFVLNQMNSS